MKRILPWAGALLVCGSAHAHAHLVASAPAEGAKLAQPPAEIVLDFSEPAQLTALEIEGTPGASAVSPSLPALAAKELRVALPALGPGAHSIRWRVLSADGHVMSGRIRFNIVPAANTEAPASR